MEERGAGEPDRYFAPPPPPSDTDYRHARWVQGVTRYGSAQRTSVPRIEATSPADPRQVLIVGVCSAGKSTLVKTLQERGYKARTCAQEHSYVPYLWELSNPDVLVYLDASLHTIRRRSRPRWRQASLDEEHRRLAHAREHCQLYIHTDGLSPEDVTARVMTYLKNNR